MHRSGYPETVSWGLVGTAVVLLLGILFLNSWSSQHDDFALYLGLLLTIAGVIAGVLELVTARKR